MAKTAERVRPGDAVELVGVLEVPTQVPVIRGATIRRTGTRPLPPPDVPTPEELATGCWDASLIRTQGHLTAHSPGLGQGARFTLELPAITPGSTPLSA